MPATTRPLPIRAAAWVLALGVCCPALADDDGLATLEPVLAAAEAPLQVPAPVALRSAGTGMASWFGPGFHGKPTASGERFDMHRIGQAAGRFRQLLTTSLGVAIFPADGVRRDGDEAHDENESADGGETDSLADSTQNKIRHDASFTLREVTSFSVMAML